MDQMPEARSGLWFSDRTARTEIIKIKAKFLHKDKFSLEMPPPFIRKDECGRGTGDRPPYPYCSKILY